MDKENGMSGWQRLGVVLSVVIAVLTICIKFDSFPTQKQASAELGNRVGFWMKCDKYYDDKVAGRKNSAEECSVYTRQYVQEKLKFEVSVYKDRLNTLTDRQVKFVAYHFAWWAGLTLIMYVIAIAMKWVYRGFRPKKA